MRVKLVWKGVVINIICVYAPQVGSSAVEKEEFWRDYYVVAGGALPGERLIVAGDFNAHWDVKQVHTLLHMEAGVMVCETKRVWRCLRQLWQEDYVC